MREVIYPTVSNPLMA